MTRAIDRLIVSGSIDPARQAPTRRRRSAGCSAGSTARTSSPAASARRSSSSAEARGCSSASTGTRRRRGSRRARAGGGRGRGGPARALRRLPAAPAPPPAPCCADRAAARAAAARRSAALVQRARALRALLVPLLRRAGRRDAAGGRARHGRRADRARGDRDRRRGAPAARARRPRGAAPPDVGQVRAWYPAVTDEELERIARLRRGVLRLRARAPVAALPGARPERPFAFEHDGVLLHGRLDVLSREGARTRARLQDEHARRGDAGGDRRGGLPPAAARLRARLLPRRGGGGRGRLPLPRAGRRGRLDDVRARRRAGARGRALRGDRADPRGRVPADAERVRLRGLPGARPRLRRAAASLSPA